MIYRLDSKPAIVAAIAAGQAGMISRRLAALAEQQGYAIGEAGIAIHRDGTVSIDSDRDPSTDWEAFDPEAMTDAEIGAQLARDAAAALLERMAAGSATQAEVRQAVAFLMGRVLAPEDQAAAS